MNPNSTPNANAFLSAIKVIYFALLMGMLLLSAVFYFILVENPTFSADFSNTHILVALATAVAGFVLSQFLFKKKLKEISETRGLKEKLAKFQTAQIVRYALIEAPVLISLIFYMLDANYFFLIVAGVLILYFLSIRPNSDVLENSLNLNSQEEMEFRKEEFHDK